MEPGHEDSFPLFRGRQIQVGRLGKSLKGFEWDTVRS